MELNLFLVQAVLEVQAVEVLDSQVAKLEEMQEEQAHLDKVVMAVQVLEQVLIMVLVVVVVELELLVLAVEQETQVMEEQAEVAQHLL